jgi:hypothetical protein
MDRIDSIQGLLDVLAAIGAKTSDFGIVRRKQKRYLFATKHCDRGPIPSGIVGGSGRVVIEFVAAQAKAKFDQDFDKANS